MLPKMQFSGRIKMSYAQLTYASFTRQKNVIDSALNAFSKTNKTKTMILHM